MVLSSNQNQLDCVYEDLHWLGLVAGYTLCDVVRGGEVVHIPNQLMKYSISRHQDMVERGELEGVDFDGNIAALVLDSDLACGGDRTKGVELSKLDPVVCLVLSVCRLCLLEKRFISQNLMDLLSPQLCETTVWCLAKITEPYIMFSDKNYQQVSPINRF